MVERLNPYSRFSVIGPFEGLTGLEKPITEVKDLHLERYPNRILHEFNLHTLVDGSCFSEPKNVDFDDDTDIKKSYILDDLLRKNPINEGLLFTVKKWAQGCYTRSDYIRLFID